MPNGTIAHDCGWSGGHWKMLGPNVIEMVFNGITHQMTFSEDKKNIVLLNPFRSPPSVATFVKPLPQEILQKAEISSTTHDQVVSQLVPYNLCE